MQAFVVGLAVASGGQCVDDWPDWEMNDLIALGNSYYTPLWLHKAFNR